MISRTVQKLARRELALRRAFASSPSAGQTIDLAVQAKSLPAFDFAKFAAFMARLETVITEDSEK